MPKIYNDKTLIKYEETIVLHFDADGAIAWLDLKNYAEVFDSASKSHDNPEVITRTVGKAPLAGTKYKPLNKPIRIGKFLNPINVIKFQRYVTKRWTKFPTVDVDSVYTSRGALNKLIALCLENALDVKDATTKFQALKDVDREFEGNTLRLLTYTLLHDVHDSPKSPWTINYNYNDFVPYFPKPSLILEEQRCRYYDDKGGKTEALDVRYLKPILWQNAELRALVAAGRVVPSRDIDDLIKAIEKEVGAEKAEAIGGLFKKLEQISCYAFHGTDRLPNAILKQGLLPQVTRTDAGVMKDKAKKEKIEAIVATLHPTAAQQRVEDSFKNGQETFVQMLARLDQLSVDLFTKGDTVKPFVSTSKSLAVAKAFATRPVNVTIGTCAYCYAVRCKWGYELPSCVPKAQIDKLVQPKNPSDKAISAQLKEYLLTTHPAANFPEQEVAKFQSIQSDDIFGYRQVRLTGEGPLLSGPVFLRGRLMGEDEGAFDELFELLSGKSQGEGYLIFPSYPKVPWD
jgi:glycosyltransferase involved in cell wall biosynthesis